LTRDLPYVDPHASHGPFYRAFVKFLGTRLAAWLSMHVVWKVDPHLMRLTGGRVGLGMMLPTALLETRGARSAQPRRNEVIYFPPYERHARPYTRTPPTCPASGYWTFTVDFTYRDGVTESIESHSPCVQPAG